MSILKKLSIIFIIPLLFYGCGYTALYTDIKNQNINIKVIESTGDREMNNYLIKNLKKYTGNEGKTYSISFDTEYSILDNSKNLEGSISSNKLLTITKFTVKENGLSKIITIKEDIIIKNLNNNFEKKNYEKSIKENFSKSIINKLILQLNSIR